MNTLTDWLAQTLPVPCEITSTQSLRSELCNSSHYNRIGSIANLMLTSNDFVVDSTPDTPRFMFFNPYLVEGIEQRNFDECLNDEFCSDFSRKHLMTYGKRIALCQPKDGPLIYMNGHYRAYVREYRIVMGMRPIHISFSSSVLGAQGNAVFTLQPSANPGCRCLGGEWVVPSRKIDPDDFIAYRIEDAA